MIIVHRGFSKSLQANFSFVNDLLKVLCVQESLLMIPPDGRSVIYGSNKPTMEERANL